MSFVVFIIVVARVPCSTTRMLIALGKQIAYRLPVAADASMPLAGEFGHAPVASRGVTNRDAGVMLLEVQLPTTSGALLSRVSSSKQQRQKRTK
jgi:hypothetical protein